MCLRAITKTDFDRDTEMTVYKVMYISKRNKTIYGWRTPLRHTLLRVGKWNKANAYDLYTEPGDIRKSKMYEAGFHCFVTKQAANYYAAHCCWKSEQVVEVKVRNIIAKGTGNGMDRSRCAVVVAREIFIPRENKEVK